MSVQNEVKGIVISPRTLLDTALSDAVFPFQILSYLENRIDLFGFLHVEDLSLSPDLSRLWLKLKRTRWRIFLLEFYGRNRYHKRRLFFLKENYRKVLHSLSRQMGRVIEAEPDNTLQYQRWLREDYQYLLIEYGG